MTKIYDIEGLPPELLRELSLSKRTKFGDQVIEIIKENMGYVDVDTILIAFYRKHKKIYKRAHLLNKLHRLIKAGDIYTSEKRGLYSINQMQGF